MTIPFKLLVLHALTDSLAAVTPANGYQSDLSPIDPGDSTPPIPRVYRGRSWFGDSDPETMVSILEGVNPAEDVFELPSDATTGEGDWQLLVQGFVRDDPLNPTDPAYYLMRDVRRRLATEQTRRRPGRNTLDPLGASLFAPAGCAVASMKIGPGVVRPADDVSAKAYFWLSLTLRIVEDAASA